MSVFKAVLAIVTLLFGALSIYAVSQVGYFGIFDYHLHSPAGWQVIADLVIVCGLGIVWMVLDGKKIGRNPWPFVVITLLAGAFGPLSYLLTRPADKPLAG